MMKKMVFILLAIFILGLSAESQRALFLQTKEKAETTAPAAPKDVSATFPMQSFKLKFANAKELGETIQGLLAKGEGIAVNERLNLLMVRASEASLKRLTKLMESIDSPPLQVQVEARLIELKAGSGDSTKPSSLGASWKVKSTKDANDYFQLSTTDTLTAAASSLGIYAQLLSGNVDVYLSALEKTIGYDLVASPWITALNHEEAEILIGSKYGYKTTLTTLTGTLQNVEFLKVGTKLKFTPHINEDGYIIMEISPSVSEGQIVNELPQENTTESKNKVLVKDGQSVVIGGLTKNYTSQVETGVPILMQIPFFGTLFRRTEIISEKREIMVIITPHIVTPEFLTQMAEQAQQLDTRRQQWKEKAKLIR